MEVGLTDTTPPVAANVVLLPLVPASVTFVAFFTDTVRTEELPFAIDVGFAVILPVGAVAATAWLLTPTPKNAGTAQGRSIEKT